AGTPLINDPGFKLVRDCVAHDILVTGIPGPCAPILALTLSGLPSDRFFYAGFLPTKSAARRAAIQELAGIPATLILLEGPSRLAECLADLALILGPRPAAIA